MSAPPMENEHFQQVFVCRGDISRVTRQVLQAPPAVPPSYEQAMASNPPYPPQGGVYPQLPSEKGAPPPANYSAPPPAGYPPQQPAPGTTTVVTQVQYVQAPSFGYR